MHPITFLSLPRNTILDLPSADEILSQIRAKRKERGNNENSKDDLEASYSDRSLRNALTLNKENNLKTLKKMGTRGPQIAEEVDDSFKSDKSD